jgi:AcrR family transcriptional regulator
LVYDVHLASEYRCTLYARQADDGTHMTSLDKADAQPKMATGRARLTRGRVLHAAVALADEIGIDALTMRRLAEELGVVPMALYKHVAGREELLDGMVDIVVAEIDPPAAGSDWKRAVRERILSARQSLQRHPWAPEVIESRTTPSPTMLAYIDSMIGMFRAGGLSADLTHHALHTMGSRLYGFSQDVFDDSTSIDPATQARLVREMEGSHPHIAEMIRVVYHDEASIVGGGCDDQFEFEFALDLLLDGLERLRHGNEGVDSSGLRRRDTRRGP